MLRFAPLALFALALATPVTLPAQALPTQTIDKVIAVVEEDVILQSELDQALANILAQYRGREAQLPPREVIERQVLERLIMLRLQLQRAENTGIRVSDTELDQAVISLAQQNNATLDQLRATLERDGYTYEEFRKTMRDELMVQRLRQRFVQQRVQVTDTEIELLLQSGGLRRGEVRLSHILVQVPDGASAAQLDEGRRKAEMITREIAGGLDFASAAIRYSDGQQALEGGDLGWRRYDEVPSVFAEVIAQMKVGDTTPALRGPSGFHILKLADQREAQPEVVREFNARHILLRTSELVSAADAEAKIRELRQRIEAGEDFAELAREFSEDTTSANQGGDMGWFEIGAYGTRVAQAIDSLADGGLSEVFQTEAGWHVLQRLGTREQDRTEERIRQQAAETIRNRKAEEEYETFLRQIRSESYVENRLAPEGEQVSG
jgi:peptidyl-prolyl cis-trans isomerase SurA